MGQIQAQGSALFVPAIKNNFWSVYQTKYTESDARLAELMGEFQSDKAAESYGYSTQAPVMRRWDEGNAIPTDAFLSRVFFCRNWKWGVGVPVSAVTVADDQLKLVIKRCKETAASAGLLKERLFWYLLTGGTVADAAQLLPGVPNCPDGVGLFSATDGGGAARFNRTGGNINTPGAGQASAAAVIQDLYTDLAAFAQFQNTQGQPLYPQGETIRKLKALHNVIYLQSWQSALNQLFNVSISGNAAPSNPVIDSGLKVEAVATQKITSSFSYVFATEVEEKAIFWQIREPMTEYVAEPGNSDRSREFDEWKFYCRMRAGAAYGLPYQVMRNG